MNNNEANIPAAPQGRADERVKLRRRAQLVVGADVEQSPQEVVLEDISFSGAGMIAGVDLPAGSNVGLILQIGGETPRTIRGHVLSSKQLEPGHFRVGMRFDAVSGPAIKRIRYAFFPDDAISE